jgi:hypothetical protein
VDAPALGNQASIDHGSSHGGFLWTKKKQPEAAAIGRG